jgi:methylated-DNA-[protein]-cysteine S-methyltransferase
MPSSGLSDARGRDGFAVIPAPFGCVEIRARGDRITSVEVFPEAKPAIMPGNPILDELARQLQAYFRDPASLITVPLDLPSTPFRARVWEGLLEIPAGTVRSYGELAGLLGSGARAVASACRHNPVALIIPCHRVVGSNHLGGYCGQVAGPYLDIKRWLLRHEGHAVRS